MPTPEQKNQPEVVKIWSATEGAGLMHPSQIAHAIAGTLTERRVSEGYLSRLIARHPTEAHIYPGTRETVETLMDYGNSVTLWTQGNRYAQAHKIASSGLSDLHSKKRGRARLGYYCHENKIPALPELIEQFPQGKPIIIVDDKSENIIRITETLRGNPDVHVIWINQGRTKDQVPDGYTPQTFKEQFATIESLPELLGNPEMRLYFEAGQAQVLLDVDHTILHSSGWKKEIERTIHAKLEGQSVIDPFADEALGLSTDEYAVAERFQNGMSGRLIASVRHSELPGEMVYKLGRSDTECAKIQREARGYLIMKQSPLAPFLVEYNTRHANMGVLSSARFPGTDIRTLLQHNHCDADDVGPILDRLARTTFDWWERQGKKEVSADYISMQRREWGETKELFEPVFAEYAKISGIPLADLLSFPIQINDVMLPPISHLIQRADLFLADSPPYMVNDHNDLTGANILLAPDGTYKILDYEWVGPADPAESFVRMAKWQSATTILDDQEVSMQQLPDRLQVANYAGLKHWAQDTGKISQQFHEYLGLAADKLQDGAFVSRVGHYFVGSYLREIALSQKRGTVQSLPIILGLIGDYAQYI